MPTNSRAFVAAEPNVSSRRPLGRERGSNNVHNPAPQLVVTREYVQLATASASIPYARSSQPRRLARRPAVRPRPGHRVPRRTGRPRRRSAAGPARSTSVDGWVTLRDTTTSNRSRPSAHSSTGTSTISMFCRFSLSTVRRRKSVAYRVEVDQRELRLGHHQRQREPRKPVAAPDGGKARGRETAP